MKELIRDCVYVTFDKLTLQNSELMLKKQGDTTISGVGSPLDSLALVNFLIMLEAEIRKRTKRDINVADEQLLLAPNQPLKNVDTLVAHIAAKLS